MLRGNALEECYLQSAKANRTCMDIRDYYYSPSLEQGSEPDKPQGGTSDADNGGRPRLVNGSGRDGCRYNQSLKTASIRRC